MPDGIIFVYDKVRTISVYISDKKTNTCVSRI